MELDSEVGPLVAVKSNAGLCNLQFGAWPTVQSRLISWTRRWYHLPNLTIQEQAFADERKELEQYLQGKREHFTFRIDLQGTSFQLQVWHALTQIPYGQTTTYQEIAHRINNPMAMRAVGLANHMNPLLLVIPCHRVIGKNGSLVGYRGGLRCKQQLLELEKKQS